MYVLRPGVDSGGSVAARGERDSCSGCASGISKASIDNTHTLLLGSHPNHKEKIEERERKRIPEEGKDGGGGRRGRQKERERKGGR